MSLKKEIDDKQVSKSVDKEESTGRQRGRGGGGSAGNKDWEEALSPVPLSMTIHKREK